MFILHQASSLLFLSWTNKKGSVLAQFNSNIEHDWKVDTLKNRRLVYVPTFLVAKQLVPLLYICFESTVVLAIFSCSPLLNFIEHCHTNICIILLPSVPLQRLPSACSASRSCRPWCWSYPWSCWSWSTGTPPTRSLGTLTLHAWSRPCRSTRHCHSPM